MTIVFTIADLQPENGGPSRSVAALAAAVAVLGAEVELLALEYGVGSTLPMMPPARVKTTLLPCRGTLATKAKWSPAFETFLSNRCQSQVAGLKSPNPVLGGPLGRGRRSVDVVIHDNGLWLPTNHAAARVARKLQIPLVISPRGMLTPWAMKFRGLKKQLAWSLYQRRDLQTASVLHATSAQEAEEFRALGLTQPIAIIPNGVELPPENRKPEIGSRKSEMRTVLFLSRIHPKKGLLDLVKAWARLKSEAGNWKVVVVGGDEGGHLEQVKGEIRKQKVEEDFEFAGEVADGGKWELFRNADLFVLPTKSENFGIVIAEALACGVPVITTRGTPWEQLRTHQCGWWVEIGVKPLAEALREALKLSDQQRWEMGRRGRELIAGRYSWSASSTQMKAVYEWMLDKREMPPCVQT